MGELSRRDRALLGRLAENPSGLPVRNAYVDLFGQYAGEGFVSLSAARLGPLGIPDIEHFWARITPAGRAALTTGAPS